ncbi:replication family domain protein [Escherichia coli 2-460-02_S3_C1]|nr:replication family domain protein [Escherichia coli 2-460-02_S3_C1]
MLKDVLQLERETNEDLIMADGMAEGTDDGSRLAFSWRAKDKKYRRDRAMDKPEQK